MTELLNNLTNTEGLVLLFIQDHLRFAALTPIMIFLSKIGDKGAIWLLISIIMLFPKKTRRVGILSILALAISYGITNMFLKNYVERIRPYEVIDGLKCIVAKADDWSFPSGHASASFACAVTIAKNCKKRFGIPALVLAFLISFSRLYVGIHFPTDVICGAVIGTLIAFILYWLFGKKVSNKKFRRARR